MRLLWGQFAVRGLLVGSRAMFEELLQLLTNNPQFKPIIDKVFPFAQAKEAYKHLESGAHFGKVVISVE
jgi:NADPH:quinone reductase-like Zn-dependent oxidoreductase